jgi:hypothetical protein
MPNKYYTVLYRSSRNEMTIPIKAVVNQYQDQGPQFAGGYPACFGGTDKGGMGATLIQEVDEESRRTLAANAPFNLFYQGRKDGDDYYFCWTTNWQETGTGWGNPSNRDEGEMMGIVTIDLNQFSSTDPPMTVLTKLIRLSGAPGGSQAQYDDFINSLTAEFFINFVYSCVPYSRRPLAEVRS